MDNTFFNRDTKFHLVVQILIFYCRPSHMRLERYYVLIHVWVKKAKQTTCVNGKLRIDVLCEGEKTEKIA